MERPTPTPATTTPDPTLPYPRILCLHGGGVTGEIFRAQARSLIKYLPTFRLVFADAPFYCAPGPGIVPVYEDWGPFRRWLRWLPEHPEIDDESAAESADAGGQGEAAEDMSTRAAQAQTPQTLDKAPPNATFVRFAQGPPAAVVRALGEDGIEAEVDPDGNVVADARPADVEAALADRPDGDVPVYVR